MLSAKRLLISKKLAVAATTVATGAITYSYFSSKNNTAYAESSTALNPQEFVPFKLEAVEKVSHNTNKYRFALPDSSQTAGTFVCSAILLKAQIGGKDVIRPYTPTSTPDTKGHFDLVIKTYEQGAMSKYLSGLKPGQSVLVKGPIPKFVYKANSKDKIGMIAGGTGITPMYQLIRAILDNPQDKTEIYLLYSNSTQDDILLKKEFDELAAKHKNFHVIHTLSKEQAGNSVTQDAGVWTGQRGRINKELVQKTLSGFDPKSESNMVCVCGPKGFMQVISGEKKAPTDQGELQGVLKDLGFSEKNVYKF